MSCTRICCFLAIFLHLLLPFCLAFSNDVFSFSRQRIPLLPLAAHNKKQPPKRRFSQAAHNTTPRKQSSPKKKSPKKKKEVWQSSKSIDDLEATMTKRWGTTLEKWTADPNEYEFVYDDSTTKQEGGVFRAKPVLDPWQEQEQQGKQQTESIFSADDVVLNRVRRNQERLRNQQQEFYDEDDEGYEPRYSNEDEDDDSIRVDHLIAPRPAGGRGTRETSESETESSGFFFNANAAQNEKQQIVITEETKQESPSKKRRRQQSVPVLDDDGNPIFLTLEQAERDFQASLSSSIDNSDDSFEPSQPKSWTELGITSDILLQNLQEMGCDSPLPVQDKACPSIITGNDVLVGTYTGSGKTLAFLVPLIQQLLFSPSNRDGVQVLIVAPGRELASQIVSVARELLEGTDIGVLLAIGGTTFSRNLEQIRKRKPSILVGTPGRIAELVVGRPGEKSGRLKIGDLQALVLDEFDALLEYKPHRDPTKAILSSLKKRHGDSLQTILCSATASDVIRSSKLENFLRPGYAQAMADRNDRLVTSGDDDSLADATRVSSTAIHGVIHVPHRRLALETIRSILYTEPTPQQVLIFADTARRVDIVIEKLAKMGIIAAPLHGGFGSEKVDRAEVSKALREGYVGIVVATELAARGLDAPLLTHVINLDLPTDASHYAHRAGRCGRGGRPGVVINITTQPRDRNVPQRFADNLGITLHTVEARSGKLNIIEPDPQLDENYRA